MLDHETNAYLCDVERGKPMHALLKRYWLPAGLSSDVAESNSEPLRIAPWQSWFADQSSAAKVDAP